MAKYYYHDVARWEGEGGSHAELIPPSDVARHAEGLAHCWSRDYRTAARRLPPSRGAAQDVRRHAAEQGGGHRQE
jgi:hypothetical protein